MSFSPLSGCSHRHICYNREKISRVIYYALAVFTLWYYFENLALLVSNHGILLSETYTEALWKLYIFYVGIYAVETFSHYRNRWGHYFVFAWAVTFVVVYVFVLFSNVLAADSHNVLRIFKIATFVVSIWGVRIYKKTMDVEHEA